MKDWHVIRVRPASEAKAAESLKRHKLEAYYPVEKLWRKTIRGRVEHLRPAVYGYIFARLDDDDMYKLHDMEGVAYAVTTFGHYRKLEVFIRWLKLVERLGMFDKTLAARRRKMAEGEPVRIIDGPFTDFQATFLRMEERGRARVMLHLFGRPTETTLTLEQLAAA